MATSADVSSRSEYRRCESREIHYVEWGAPAAPPVLLWHGLARTGRDFDELAAALAADFRVICPDMLGRGLSQWSPLPDAEYCLDFYASVARTFVDQLGIAHMRWIGTSMGGAIGIRAAATTLQGRISHLVLNDIGAVLPVTSGSERILTYVGNPPAFDTMTEFESYLRNIYRPYGWQSDTAWRWMAETSSRRLPSGKITSHYDPSIVRQFVTHPDDYQQWRHYDCLEVPTLLLRGVDSDVLPRDVAQEMTQRGPGARLVEISGCGHAPALNVPAQIEHVRRFIAGGFV